MERLMNVPDPVPEELERGELGPVVVGSPQDIQVSRDRGEEALRHAVAAGRGDRLQGPWHVDEVFLGSLAGWSGHVQASVKELNVASRAINRMTSLRALSLSSSKAIWQMILWPRSPHAHDGDGHIMLPRRKRNPKGNQRRAWSRVVRLLFMTFLPSGMTERHARA